MFRNLLHHPELLLDARNEIERLINAAKARGAGTFQAGSMEVECVGLYTEFVWRVAGELTDEDCAQRVIASYLLEQARDRALSLERSDGR